MSNQELVFSEVVIDKFLFLKEHGFVIEEINPTRVGYKSQRYRIYIYYGRHSNEIGFEFSPIERSPFGSASLETLVAIFNKEVADAMPGQIAVHTQDALERRVTFLANTLRRYVDFDRFDSQTFWEDVVAEGTKRFQARYPAITPAELHRQFQAMWRNKSYAELIRRFGPLEKLLSSEERKILDSAKKLIAQK